MISVYMYPVLLLGVVSTMYMYSDFCLHILLFCVVSIVISVEYSDLCLHVLTVRLVDRVLWSGCEGDT